MALLAYISSYQDNLDKRVATRRSLRLSVGMSASCDEKSVLVHNISERGLLPEAPLALQVGDRLVVDLPEIGATAAEVIWARAGFAGCKFAKRISKAAISAGLLRSFPEGPPYTIAPTQPHFLEAEVREEPVPAPVEGPWIRALTLASLLLATVIATIFIVTLLVVPFAIE